MSCQVNSSDQKEDGQVQRVCSDVLCMVEDVKGSVGACTSILLRLVCGVCGTECSSVGRAIDCSVGCCVSVCSEINWSLVRFRPLGFIQQPWFVCRSTLVISWHGLLADCNYFHASILSFRRSDAG